MPETTLEQYFDQVWSQIERGVRQRKHGFHLGTIATSVDDFPEARIVVLRHADPVTTELGFHTDFRVGKVSAMQTNPQVCWVFYCPRLMMQVQMFGLAVIHHMDDLAKEKWDQALLLSKRCYLAPLAPGTLSDVATSGLPPELEDREPTFEEAIPGFANFCVVRTKIQRIEMLHTIFTGYRRAEWTLTENGWVGTWKVP
jgi:3-hydroxyisobutyrate dehydrogenase